MVDVLVLHPGAMGGAVAACLRAVGHRPHWVGAGRSAASRARAASAGAVEHPDLTAGLAAVSVVLSVCPPDNAVEVATEVARAAAHRADGRPGPVFVDANAVAPVTMRAIASIMTGAGVPVVDGGIIGPPPLESGTTRLYLSGERADEVAALFPAGSSSALETIVVSGDVEGFAGTPGPIGAASGLKMTFAAWTKGSAALMLEVAAAARAHGVEDALRAEWARSRPQLGAQVDRAAGVAAPKAWRWKGEMEEVAATFAEKGLPAGTALGAAEVYRRLAGFKDQSPPPDLDAVVGALLDG